MAGEELGRKRVRVDGGLVLGLGEDLYRGVLFATRKVETTRKV